MTKVISTKCFLILAVMSTMASSWAQTESAGRESLFSIGAGARSLSLGRATVSYPADPSAYLSNPAGMKVVPQRALDFSMTTLFEGSNYNFLGYVHPTLSAGVFGIGFMRIGTGGIQQTDWDPVGHSVVQDLGQMEYWWGKLTLSYAFGLTDGLSAGVNFNSHRQVLGDFTTNGFGLDAGLHYRFNTKNVLLKNIFIGAMFENVMAPKMKLGTHAETLPGRYAVGAGKRFQFGSMVRPSHLLVLADYEKGEFDDGSLKLGMEYAMGQSFFLRAGYDGQSMGAGGGLRFKQFQIDYANTQIGDALYFPRSHRFSITWHMGQSLEEQRKAREARRMKEVQERFNEEMNREQQTRVREGLRQGRAFLEKEEYFFARLEFERVLMEDPGHPVARRLLEDTKKKEEVWKKEQEAVFIKQGRQEEQAAQEDAYVNQRFNAGVAFLERGEYRNAIETWQSALNKYPENDQLKTYIENAEIALENEVNRQIAVSRQWAAKEEIANAYQVLEKVKSQTIPETPLRVKVDREVQALDRQLNFLTNYQAGLQRYSQGEYSASIDFFKKALDYRPNHKRARELYRNAIARSTPVQKKEIKTDTDAQIRGDVQPLFNEGVQLYRIGRYEEALKVWESALEIDPDDVSILKAIEGVQRKLQTYKNQSQSK